MGLFGRNKNVGILDSIRCDEPSYLIWKWNGDSRRGNSIRCGSHLRVNVGSVAAFFNSACYGDVDYIEGPCDLTLETQNLPVLSNVLGLAYNGNTPFPAEVYFINLARIMQVPFGVGIDAVFDPIYQNYSVPVMVRGTISFNITDYANFVKLHRLENFSEDAFKKQIRSAVTKYVKTVVINAPEQYNIPVLRLESKIGQISDLIESDLTNRLEKDFGVNVTGVDVDTIEIDRDSDDYLRLLQLSQR